MASWAIFDRDRQYINVQFPTKQAALNELRELLLPYPPDSDWRVRIQVKPLGTEQLVGLGEPPYGYLHKQHSRHGQHIVEFPAEQRIIRMVYQMHALGMTYAAIARRLNAHGRRPRHGSRFTPLMIDELLEETRRRDEYRRRERRNLSGAVAEATGT